MTENELLVSKIENGIVIDHIPDFDYIFGPSYKGISLAALTCEGLNELWLDYFARYGAMELE